MEKTISEEFPANLELCPEPDSSCVYIREVAVVSDAGEERDSYTRRSASMNLDDLVAQRPELKDLTPGEIEDLRGKLNESQICQIPGI